MPKQKEKLTGYVFKATKCYNIFCDGHNLNYKATYCDRYDGVRSRLNFQPSRIITCAARKRFIQWSRIFRPSNNYFKTIDLFYDWEKIKKIYFKKEIKKSYE